MMSFYIFCQVPQPLMFTVIFRSPWAPQAHLSSPLRSHLTLDTLILHTFSHSNIKAFSVMFHDLGILLWELSNWITEKLQNVVLTRSCLLKFLHYVFFPTLNIKPKNIMKELHGSRSIKFTHPECSGGVIVNSYWPTTICA